jgi:hypothetical protein
VRRVGSAAGAWTSVLAVYDILFGVVTGFLTLSLYTGFYREQKRPGEAGPSELPRAA